MSTFKIIFGPFRGNIVEVLQMPSEDNCKTVRIKWGDEFLFGRVDRTTLSRWQRGIYGRNKRKDK